MCVKACVNESDKVRTKTLFLPKGRVKKTTCGQVGEVTPRLYKPKPGCCTQFLCIQSLLDLTDSCLNTGVKAGFFFDFLYRVDSGSVVFTAKLTGDLRKAEV